MEIPDHNEADPVTSPIPWLGTRTEEEGLPRQAWNPEIEERVYFTLEYNPSLAEHKRCIGSNIWLEGNASMLLMVSAVVMYGFIVVLMYLVDSLFKWHWQKLSWSLIGKPLPMFLSFLLFIGYMAWSSNQKQLKKIAEAGCPPMTLTVASTYVEWERLSQKYRYTYRQLQGVFYQMGDVHIRGLNAAKTCYVPRSAFADGDSMELLYEALYSLWKGNGSLSALSPEVRARFVKEAP